MRNISPAMIPALFALLALCLMAAGCTGTSDTIETTPYETSSTGTAEATTAPAAAGTTVSGAAEGSVAAVSYTGLIPFLPNAPAGWSAEEPVGASLAVEDDQWTWASRDYSKDDAWATIIIQDSAYQDVGYWGSWDSFVSFETTEGYYKQRTVSGHPSREFFSKPDSYGTWVGVNERFMVYVNVEGGSKQDLDALVNAVNYGGIGYLK
ncbi:hypothetical protein FGW20_06030 [Methanoculleus sp. FWC-SCC3]|uniref:Lipoprotein n=1 Tax=Methanoculleus methanifontis TaxID=2584086 RepID=A0ABT8M0Q3_9EURY|nr:hypothetical protein [Methanoculleus sp. FWC-SCC3]MDN7012604.1 hypothetical protein [Methanoculleus sp. FWC-SCC3]